MAVCKVIAVDRLPNLNVKVKNYISNLNNVCTRAFAADIARIAVRCRRLSVLAALMSLVDDVHRSHFTFFEFLPLSFFFMIAAILRPRRVDVHVRQSNVDKFKCY